MITPQKIKVVIKKAKAQASARKKAQPKKPVRIESTKT